MDRESSNWDEGEELLEAQTHIFYHIFNFINSLSLKCAVQLGIPDVIDNHQHKPLSLFELGKALKIPQAKSAYLFRLMRVLVHSGFFATKRINGSKEEGYLLTPSSKLLLKNHPMSMSQYLLVVLDPVLVAPCHFFSDWFRMSDEVITPFEVRWKKSLWSYFGENQVMGKLFDESMACDSRLVMNVVLKKFKMKFEGLQSLVDVGGGDGTASRIMVETFPDMKCTVLDLPQVVGTFQGSENLEFVGGDMFQSIPSAHAVFLKWIIHNWNDEECLKILKRCKDAIPSKGGKLIIIDIVVDERSYKSTQSQLYLDMLMMILLTGRERTKLEWEKLFFNAGFSTYNITPLYGFRSLIEVYP